MRIENDNLVVDFGNAGGEMTSLVSKDNGYQYLWQGDTGNWSGMNPTLFPIVGNTYNGKYTVDGEEYQMRNHGLVRYSDLECMENKSDSITFQLVSSEQTLESYPFDFGYQVRYELEGPRVKIEYKILNSGNREMPFTMGMHPGFNCPLKEGEVFEDYYIEFEEEENLKQIVFDPKLEMPPHERDITLRRLPLDYSMFEKYQTLIYKNVKSKRISLKSKETQIDVGVEGFPFLAFWTPKPGAPFICVEPWYSHGDFTRSEIPFKEREGMKTLLPGEEFHTEYYIEIKK